MSISSYILDTNTKYSTYIGILVLVTGILMSGSLIAMLKNEHYMDEKQSLVCALNLIFSHLIEITSYSNCWWL